MQNRNPFISIILYTLKYAIIMLSFIILMQFAVTHIIMNGYIPSASMEPGLKEGDFIIGNRLVKKYHRGNVAIFWSEENKYYIKRIIGVGGDHIVIKDHAVYCNGKKLKEPYIKEEMLTDEELEYTVPKNCYFFLGDNRNYSKDSRYWKYPFINKKDMIAKVMFRYWPSIKKI